MKLKEWLLMLGRANGSKSSDRYLTLAPFFRSHAARLDLSASVAQHVAATLRGQFPTEGELMEALRPHLPSAQAVRVLGGGSPEPPPPPAPPAVRGIPPDPESEDRRHWLARIVALEHAPVCERTYLDAVWLWDVLTRPPNGTDPGAAPRPWAVDRVGALVADLERCLGRVGECAARPPLSLEAMRAPPPPGLARDRSEWVRPPRGLSGWQLLDQWRKEAEAGGPMAGAARIRVALLEEQAARAMAARAAAEQEGNMG